MTAKWRGEARQKCTTAAAPGLRPSALSVRLSCPGLKFLSKKGARRERRGTGIVSFLTPVWNYVDALVHPAAQSDALTAARHRAFIAPVSYTHLTLPTIYS